MSVSTDNILYSEFSIGLEYVTFYQTYQMVARDAVRLEISRLKWWHNGLRPRCPILRLDAGSQTGLDKRTHTLRRGAW